MQQVSVQSLFLVSNQDLYFLCVHIKKYHIYGADRLSAYNLFDLLILWHNSK